MAAARRFGVSVRWMAPQLDADRGSLSSWRRSVGPPVVVSPAASPTEPYRSPDRRQLEHARRRRRHRRPARRRPPRHGAARRSCSCFRRRIAKDPKCRCRLEPHASFASLIRRLRPDGSREEIESVARAARAARLLRALDAQRRAGCVGRGSRQRHSLDAAADRPQGDRAAVRAAAPRRRRGDGSRSHHRSGRPWRVRVVSAHLDNMVGARRLWIAGGEFGRTRQARGLVSALAGRATRWCSARISTPGSASTTAPTAPPHARSPETPVTDRRATFHGLLRLDHLFFRLDEGGRRGSTRRRHLRTPITTRWSARSSSTESL